MTVSLGHQISRSSSTETKNNLATSEGGYGGHPFTQANQRGARINNQNQNEINSNSNSDPGLIQQSPNGAPLSSEIQDAKQGEDLGARRAFQERGEGNQNFGESSLWFEFVSIRSYCGHSGSQGLNPYGHSIETDDEANANIVSQIKDTRAREY